MLLEQSVPIEEAPTSSPLWTVVGAPGPNRPARKAGILDVYNTLFVPRIPRCTEEEIAQLRERGLTVKGALLLRKGFFAGNIGDLTHLGVRAVQEGGFTGILTFPNNDTGPDELCACPYIAGMFGKDPKDLDLLAIPELRTMPDAFIALLNRRASDIFDQDDAFRTEQCSRANVRQFHLDALELVFATREEKGELGEFEAYWEAHSQDGDRLLDYAVAKALEEKYNAVWQEWPDEIVRQKPVELIAKDPGLLKRARQLLFAQQILGEQWGDCAQQISDAGGYLVEDRSYSVLPHNAEVWRDWREQHVDEEKKTGIFHLNADKTPAFLTGCAVEGDPAGDQQWPHVVAKYIENPDGMIDYIVETIAYGGKRVSAWRIDHALAWIWQYYRRWKTMKKERVKDEQTGKDTEREKEVWEGEYKAALKEKIFTRLRERFPDTEWILEDCGHTDSKLKDFMRSVGCGPMATVQWGPDFAKSWQPRSSNFETYDVLPHGGSSFFRNADTRAEEEWFRALTEDNQRFYLGQLYPHDFQRKWQEHVVEGKPIPVIDWYLYACRCSARFSILNLQGLSAVVEGKRDERRPNWPNHQHPSYWQLLSTLSEEDLGTVFRETRRIIEETGRAVREVTEEGPLQVLALSQQPGEVRQVKRGGTYRLRIACNMPPAAGTAIELSTTRRGAHWWAPEPARIEKCTHHRDGRFIWDASFDIPAEQQPGTFELCGTIRHCEDGSDVPESHDLCEIHKNLLIQVV
ncbi:MAG: 4-alpha-glucanotransferase [Candidatus Peribacteraceae bacterium]